MRTRSKSKRPQSVDEPEAVKGEGADDNETLSNISRDGVGKLLKRVKKGFSKEDVGYLRHSEPAVAMESEKRPVGTTGGNDTARAESHGHGREAMEFVSDLKYDDDDGNGFDDSEWEDGLINNFSSVSDSQESLVNGVSVEFDVSPGLAKRKRATAEEKQVSELVHQAHLLCLLGRGRLVDSACNDPLIQASLLSLVPTHLLKVADKPKLTASCLTPFVSWFHKYFRVKSPSLDEESFHVAMASTLERQEGTPEAVAALSVALFRALNLTTRFVSILDVVSLKPEADKSEDMLEFGNKRARNIFDSATPMVAGPSSSSVSAVKSSPDKSRKDRMQSQDALSNDKPKVNMSVSETTTNTSETCLVNSERLKNKGDLEFEMQLEMAMAATAVGSSTSEPSTASSTLTPLSKGMRRIIKDESQTSSNGVSTAIGSKKVGAPLYWAEVFCRGENLTGKWVHVDVTNAVVDGEDKVEAAAAACKRSLRYVVAFAGNGAKDVTRRYCTKWYKVAPQRISSTWWNAVLAPLKELESAATAGTSNLEFEDMELETRALTEPLPTNQQAYRNHHLYAIEKWLKKYQILHPKGPVLGFISGHPVYPRACVQTLRTKERWLREGLQVKAGEDPAKVLNRSLKSIKEAALNENNNANRDHLETTMVLYGKWQTEPLFLPRAVNGIVPKNERGRVDVWSEKCLPPGTVHLRLPRVAHVARRLGIDYASAMVGFEYRNGKSVPSFEGIVVCSEFKDSVLAAYAEEEARRESEEKKKNEAQALSRWYQLLSSIITRQRLNTLYGERESSKSINEIPKQSDRCSESATPTQKREVPPVQPEAKSPEKKHDISTSNPIEDHEHEFVIEEQASSDGRIQIKRCHCGFSVQFEEL